MDTSHIGPQTAGRPSPPPKRMNSEQEIEFTKAFGKLDEGTLITRVHPLLPCILQLPTESEFFINNLLVRIHFIIVMIRWTGLAPWEFDARQRLPLIVREALLDYYFFAPKMSESELEGRWVEAQRRERETRAWSAPAAPGEG